MSEIMSNSQIRVIKTILQNPGINLREIIEKTKLSPNYVSKFVNSLVNKKIVNEKKLKKKRVYLRNFSINMDSELTKNLLYLVYEEEKNNFFSKYPFLKKPLEDVSELSEIKMLVVYGSYARFSADKNSDLDILFVGNKIKKDKINEYLVSLNIDLSTKIETPRQFESRKEDALHSQIFREGIVIKGTKEFLELVK